MLNVSHNSSGVVRTVFTVELYQVSISLLSYREHRWLVVHYNIIVQVSFFIREVEVVIMHI